MSKSTRVQLRDLKDRPEPWRSWPLTARYVLVQLTPAVSNLVLVWLAIARR